MIPPDIEAMRTEEMKRVARHAADCYAPFKCQSCGCQRPKRLPCVSHQRNPMHLADLDARRNELLERIADALGVAKP